MNRTAFLTALAITFIGVAMLWLYTERFETEITGGEVVEVLIAQRDLAIDDALVASALGTRSIPRKYLDRHILASDRSRVEGERLLNKVRASQSIYWSDLRATADEQHDLAANVRNGMRAISIPIRSTDGFGGLLRPGDTVDVLLTSTKPGSEDLVSVPLLQMVLVLAVGSELKGGTRTKNGRGARNATLLVSLKQATVLALARDEGELQLVLRNPDDVDVQENIPDTTKEDLIDAVKRIRNTKRRKPQRDNDSQIKEIK